MFTVCPKCALTLVVTAADLRVAQGYVRCGRCSNVFNALSRLSEDRQSAAAQAQPSSETPPAPKSSSTTSTTTRTRIIPDSSATSRTRLIPDSTGTTRTRVVPDSSATSRTDPGASAQFQLPQDPAATSSAKAVPAPSSEPKRYDDDSILEEDLEFNPAATDLNEVFVEQPPSPQFAAATGTFKAARLEAEESARTAEERHQADERKTPESTAFDPVDTQVDVEIDPDLLATMAELTSNRLERLNPTPPETVSSSQLPAEPSAPDDTTSQRRAAAHDTGDTTSQPRIQTPSRDDVPEQPPQQPASMRLAERAKARVEAARTAEAARAADTGSKSGTAQKSHTRKAEENRATALETARAIRAALTPRRRSIPETTPAPTSFFSGPWTGGSALLLLLLVIQVVHHYRNDLAANATLNGPLTSIYAMLGEPIVPHWDLGAYEVRQLGASTAADAPGQIMVRASVKNGARQAQPLPLLRVTLQDRFGNRIASRDVPPQSYLPRVIPTSSRLSAGQRIDAEMAFVDPGENAVGFEIDACLPAPGGGISCANDVPR
jgi:predicted Zn finger-like uncharacterized protein